MKLKSDVRTMGLVLMNRTGKSLEETLSALSAFGEDQAKAFEEWYREETRKTFDVDTPSGFILSEDGPDYEHIPWVPPPDSEVDLAWPALKPRLIRRVGPEATDSVQQAADKILNCCLNPTKIRHSRRGLVVGYVQSGKTANYTATIARAVDLGYRFVVVLAGLHNALRRQTQIRLEEDLFQPSSEARVEGDWHWVPVTDRRSDFPSNPVHPPEALLSVESLRTIGVVKKNATRLRNLVRWLERADESTRAKCPMLLVDDEADQASIDTARARDANSTINGLIKDLLGLMPTSTYLGYTATPYANVLIDPEAEQSLYPRHFILSLPKPEGHQGPEVLFGRNELDEDDDAADGYDVIRNVPPEDVSRLVPPTSAEARAEFSPTMTPSLERALRWFLLATAARRVRGQHEHSSMLVHTTSFVDPQFSTAGIIQETIDEFTSEDSDWRNIWESEVDRHVPPTSADDVEWEAVNELIPEVLRDAEVVVDNGASDDRLDYSGDEPRTVVAVGGNTLSRGLTLEGLVASYFLRGAGSYDSLMQMGRWFGFRPGYEDLPRIWTEAATREAFRFLSTVEEEIRQDIRRYETQSLTPEEAGVRIRCHPSLAVTSALKMQAAHKAEVSYSGKRLQTFLFSHRDKVWLRNNLEAGRELVDGALQAGVEKRESRPGVFILEGVPAELVGAFLRGYRFHEDHADLDGDRILTWLARREEAGAPVRWNVAIIGRQSSTVSVQGRTLELGRVDVGLPEPVNAINRARMTMTSKPERADIKTLLSPSDRVVDLLGADPEGGAEKLMAERRRLAPDTALLTLHPISKHSIPLRPSQSDPPAREALDALEHILGVGLVFPEAPEGMEDDAIEYDYVQVSLVDTDPEDVDERWLSSLEDDNEDDAEVELPELEE